QDKTQATMMNMMPYLITFIMAKFPAGLVIYWTFSNFWSVAQQYVLMRSMGIEVHFFHRPPEEKEMEEMIKKGPAVHPGLDIIEHEIEDALFGHEDGADESAP